MFLQSLFFAGSSPVRNGERDAAGKWGGGWERAVLTSQEIGKSFVSGDR